MLTFEHHHLGETDDAVKLSTAEGHRLAVTGMARQCRRSIEIVSLDLDPAIYDSKDFVNAVRQLILEQRGVQVRVLVFEPVNLVKRGHRMLELMYQLTSFIEFRKPGEEYDDFNEALFLADSIGYVLRNNNDRYEGIFNFNDKRAATLLRRKFNEIWERAKPDPNLRPMRL